MKIVKKNLEKSQVQLEVEVAPDEMEKYFDLAARKLAKDIEVPGFRPGKAPRKVLETRLGKNHIFEEAANLALTRSYAEAVVKENLAVIGEPEIKVKKIALGDSFIFEATLQFNYYNSNILITICQVLF